jgi:hypothetical protein
MIYEDFVTGPAGTAKHDKNMVAKRWFVSHLLGPVFLVR